jgi:uncharacterized protein (TIGR02147 family)
MLNVFVYRDFRSYLAAEFEQRLRQDPGFSKRKFAHLLGISQSRFSEILHNKGGLSLALANKIAKALKLTDFEREYFFDLVLAESGRTEKLRKEAAARVDGNRFHSTESTAKSADQGVLEEPYYLALIELLTMQKMPQTKKISDVLNISESELKSAIQFLVDKKQIFKDENGSWQKFTNFIRVDAATPTAKIRDFHKHHLKRAVNSIEAQPIKNRKYLTSVMGFNRAALEAARTELEKFNREFVNKYTSQDNADAVYCLGLQFFNLDDSAEGKA